MSTTHIRESTYICDIYTEMGIEAPFGTARAASLGVVLFSWSVPLYTYVGGFPFPSFLDELRSTYEEQQLRLPAFCFFGAFCFWFSRKYIEETSPLLSSGGIINATYFTSYQSID